MNHGRDRADRHAAPRSTSSRARKFVADFIGNGEHVRGPHDRGRAGPRAHQVDGAGRRRSTSITASAPRRTRSSGRRSGPRRSRSCVEPPEQTDNVTQGVVKEIAYMGDMSIYLVQLDTGKTVRVTQPNVDRQSDDDHLGRDRLAQLARVQPGRADRNERARRGAASAAPQRRLAVAALPRALPPVSLDALAPAALRLVTGRTAGHRDSVPVAAAVLPDPVPDRAEDLLRGDAARRVPPYTPLFECTAGQDRCRSSCNVGNYLYLVDGAAVLSTRISTR